MPSIRRARRMPGTTTIFQPRPTIPDFIPTSFVQPRGLMPDSTAIGQMAEDMREATYREGGVTEDDLKVKGWSAGQIKRLGDDARQLAQQRASMG